jgi:hypothetical protein
MRSLQSNGRGVAFRMPYLSRFAGHRSRPGIVRSARTGWLSAAVCGQCLVQAGSAIVALDSLLKKVPPWPYGV